MAPPPGRRPPFEGLARGIQCSCAVPDAAGPLDLEIRAGLHTGEVERQVTASPGWRSTSGPAWRR